MHDSNSWVDPFGLSGKLTIYSDSPTGDPISHAFISITENGKTEYIGQWPGGEGFSGVKDIGRITVSDMEGTLVNPDTSHLDSPHLVSKSYQLDDNQITSVRNYIADFDSKNTSTKGYNLRNRQCASFAYGASQAAGIKEMKMPWYKWATPASLANKIDTLNCK